MARGQRNLVEHLDRTGPLAAGEERAGEAECGNHHGVVRAPQRPVVPLGRPPQWFGIGYVGEVERQLGRRSGRQLRSGFTG